MRLLGISGSLRAASFNAGLLRAARELAPTGVEVVLAPSLGELPLYNQDLESAGAPSAVAALKAAVQAADGLLIATPEYNYSIPGGLKNAVDWLSRLPATTVLKRKPVGIVGASGGGSGTARAQLALRQCFVFTETLAMLKPEYLLAQAPEKFDSAGNLTDPEARRLLAAYLAALVDWVSRFLPHAAA